MADLSNLIYPAAVSRPQQGGRAAELPGPRPRLPRQAGAAGGLAPLLSILAMSAVLLIGCAFAGHLPATHMPRPELAHRAAPTSHALPGRVAHRTAVAADWRHALPHAKSEG
jgi:hypothetical protein